MDWQNLKEKYFKNLNKLMIIPFILLIIFISILGYSKISTGEFIQKDISLKGGLLISVQTSEQFNLEELTGNLEKEFSASVRITELNSISGGRIGYTFEISKIMDATELKPELEKVIGIPLTENNYSVEEMSSALSESFWQSTIRAIILAFVFMSVVVFAYFRKLIPSAAVVLCGFSDLIGTLAIINLLGIRLSTAGVAALLMLIGYSVDTDVLLSARVLKRSDAPLMERMTGSVKTGVLMTLTTFVALTVMYIVAASAVLRTIASILLIGLTLDLINTWIQNAGILKWYVERKNVKA